MSQAQNFTTPVGRLVGGSLSEPQTTDAEGKPLVTKTGPNAGQPRVDYYFALAIPKGAEQHWAHTEWGGVIYQTGAAAFPQAHQGARFAWKVQDGDSQVPNGKGKRNCDRPGYPGHWILSFSGGFVPNLYSQQGATFTQITDLTSVKLGYYVQVQGNVSGNGSQQQPGVFINHRMICLRGYGEVISVGPDVASAGFGAAPLPAGASAVPLAGQMPPAPAAPAFPGAPNPAPFAPPGAAPALAPVAGYAPAPVGMPAPVMAVAPLVATPPAPVAAVNPTLMPVPGAPHTIEQLRAGGWTDDQIVAAGHATRIVAAPVPAPLPPAISAPAPVAPAAPIAPAGLVPNPAFAHIPAPGAPAAPIAPPPPAAPAAPVGPQLTPAGVAAGGTYASFIAQGWNDAAMRQNGYLV